MKAHSLFIAALFVLASCNNKDTAYDASGTFEAVETIVSAEATGTIRQFNIQEGETIQAGATVGYIDSLQLHLKKKQLQAQIRAVLSKKPNVSKQLSALYEQLAHARNEQQRIERLLKSDAATKKQYDDAVSQAVVIEKQIDAQQSSLNITTTNLSEEALPLQAQIDQLNDQLKKCKIVNETGGTVLAKYAEAFEMATTGKPLYKVADVGNMILRAYVTGDQLPEIKIGKQVTVLVNAKDDQYKEYPGVVQWISDKAEFTPKTIQTKDERANLVYAVKISVKNDGVIKIGMYGDVKL